MAIRGGHDSPAATASFHPVTGSGTAQSSRSISAPEAQAHPGDPVDLQFHFGCVHARHPVGGCSAARDLARAAHTAEAASTMECGDSERGHTRSGADDESRTRGLDHGVVALCRLSYIRLVARRRSGQYRGESRGKLSKSLPLPAVRSDDRGHRADARAVG